MKLKTVLCLMSLAIVAVGPDVYAVDPSICNSGSNVVLYDNGSLRSCDLKNDYKVNNIRCKQGRIIFYDNGILESCVLSATSAIGENKCDQFGLVTFHPDGKLKSCRSPAN